MLRKSTTTLFIFFVFLSSLLADEGLWLPIFLKQLNEKDMRNLGMKLKAEDIYSINKGSLKDAVVLFGGGCTGEIVSSEGLLFTNHHCGYGQIQSHTTIENNILKNGFWAKSHSEELKCSGLTVSFISRIEDVSDLVLKGVIATMNEVERQTQIDKNIESLKSTIKKEAYEDLSIKSFFAGNQYFAFISITYKDIRLVGSPPESIGKFGSDTDNWEWPRHTGDFSVFRVYAGQDNLPAEYNENNKPFIPKHFLPISLNGIKEGDFTMVFGFPGRTDEYLPAVAVKQITQSINPIRIAMRDKALKIMDAKMRIDPKIKIQYASKYAGIANSWKKWIGESQGIEKKHGIDKKKKYEQEFTSRIKLNPDWQTSYSNILPQFDILYNENEKYIVSKEGMAEMFSRIVEIFRPASSALQLIKAFETKGQDGFDVTKATIIKGIPGFYKNFNIDIDREMFVELMKIYKQKVNADYIPGSVSKLNEKDALELYNNSVFNDEAKWRNILQLPSTEAIMGINNDPIIKLLKEANDFNLAVLSPKSNDLQNQITTLQRSYMKAQMEVFNEKKFYPDANSTMRVSYGKVKSYSPKDGVTYNIQTTIDGVMEKYIASDYEFDLDAHYRDLYNRKDYGRYGQKGTLPVCFLGANHTTGGNSGSPVIDANGNLIGLNFDRVWEGTMSDMNYDSEICRNIIVDIRYVLWIIDKYAGAQNLINEMTIVQKNKSK